MCVYVCSPVEYVHTYIYIYTYAYIIFSLNPNYLQLSLLLLLSPCVTSLSVPGTTVSTNLCARAGKCFRWLRASTAASTSEARNGKQKANIPNTSISLFYIYLPNLLVGVGFGASMALKTRLWIVEVVDLFDFLMCSSKTVFMHVCSRHRNSILDAYVSDTRRIDIRYSTHRDPIFEPEIRSSSHRDPIFEA